MLQPNQLQQDKEEELDSSDKQLVGLPALVLGEILKEQLLVPVLEVLIGAFQQAKVSPPRSRLNLYSL